MLNEIIDYTIFSFDTENYNKIDLNLPSPPSRKAKFIVSSITTKCSIVVIENDDFIQIDNKKYYFNNQYTDINSTSFVTLLNDIIKDSGVKPYLDATSRIVLESDSNFVITNISYNIIQMIGFYDQILPIYSSKNFTSNKYEIIAQSIGNTLSTPVLYMVSNLGKSSYRNLNDNLNISKIVLRINNSFSANYPIIIQNADFEVEINSNDLSHLSLTLVDANLHEIHLLNPMYITISVQGIYDDDDNSFINL